VFVSNIARRLPLNTPHQRRSCESMWPRRQPAPLVGKSYHVVCSVLASVFHSLSLVICMPHALFCESATTSYARAGGLPFGYVMGVHLFWARSSCRPPCATGRVRRSGGEYSTTLPVFTSSLPKYCELKSEYHALPSASKATSCGEASGRGSSYTV